ncbi:MAG: hypothetical protein ACRELD_02690 [Longimicrobiales bacterium]
MKAERNGEAAQRARVAAALEEIPGVLAASIAIGDNGRPHAVWIAAAAAGRAHRIRRAAVETLRTLGIAVPPEAVRVGSIREGEIPLEPLPGDVAPQAAATGPASPPPPPEPAPDPPSRRNTPEGLGRPATPAGTEPPTGSQPDFALDEEIAPAWQGRFLVLDDLELHSSHRRVRANVRLVRLGEAFDAAAEDVDTELGRARAAARATLTAAQTAARAVTLALDGLQIVSLFGRRQVAIAVDAVSDRRFTQLSALVAIETSPEHAAALAALRAVERWIAW